MAVKGLEFLFECVKVREPVPIIAVAVAACLLQASYLPVWAARYTKHSRTIIEKQIRAAHWISNYIETPEGNPIAINDAGVLAYLGNKKIFDLVGLVTNETTRVYRRGEGGLYEYLESMAPEKRPLYAAVFPSWFEEMALTYDIFHPPPRLVSRSLRSRIREGRFIE